MEVTMSDINYENITSLTKLSWWVFRILSKLAAKTFGTPEDSIEGKWTTAFPKDGRLQQENADLAQIGPFVSGFIHYPKLERTYKLRGNIRHRVLTAMYEPAKRVKYIDRGSFTLMGNPAGTIDTLDGCYAWLDDNEQKPQADTYVWIREGNPSFHERIEVRFSEKIKESGVFASKNFRPSEIINFFEGDVVNKSTDYSLHLDRKIIEPSGILRSLNHSCTPNAKFNGAWLIATCAINRHEEITIDYQAYESQLVKSFSCLCGSSNCRDKIK